MAVMKKIASLSFVLTALLSTVSAHNSMVYPLPRGHPLNPNAAVKDYDCIKAPLENACGNKPFPCGGYQPDTAITQSFKAGDVFNVKFGNEAADLNNPASNQARHNGGLCEFALSYDAGKTWSRIATYHNTCPDIFYQWPVKIPENAPSCDSCLFSWSWINAVGNREFYQNCADVKIVGTSTDPLPATGITMANLQGFPIMTPPGDPANAGNAKGSGPQQSDIDANTQGGGPAPSDGGSGSGSGSGSGNGTDSGSGTGSGTGSGGTDTGTGTGTDTGTGTSTGSGADGAPPSGEPSPTTTTPGTETTTTDPDMPPTTLPADGSQETTISDPTQNTPNLRQAPSNDQVESTYTGRCIKRNAKGKCVKRRPKCLKLRKGECIKLEGHCIEIVGGRCARRAKPVCLDKD